MKCPDCKDGFYYPFNGPKVTCDTCNGTQQVGAGGSPSQGYGNSTVKRRLTMVKSERSKMYNNLAVGSWYTWDTRDHTVAIDVWHNLVEIAFLRYRSLVADLRSTPVKSVYSDDDPDTFKQLTDMAHIDRTAPILFGPDIELMIDGEVYWHHAHGIVAMKSFMNSYLCHAKAGDIWQFSSTIATNRFGKFALPEFRKV